MHAILPVAGITGHRRKHMMSKHSRKRFLRHATMIFVIDLLVTLLVAWILH
jgi:hypothetical protein